MVSPSVVSRPFFSSGLYVVRSSSGGAVFVHVSLPLVSPCGIFSPTTVAQLQSFNVA